MNCKVCKGPLILDRINHEITITETVKEGRNIVGTREVTCVVEDVLVERCENCAETTITSAGHEHIERERIFFENQGIHIRIEELCKLNYAEIAERWGENTIRQEIYQIVKNLNKGGPSNARMSLLNAFKFASIINVPFTELFEYRPIIILDGKYYLAKEKQR